MPNAVTMSQYFSRFGYRAESLGKVFHIGHGNLGDPQAFEVPHFHDKVIEYLVPEARTAANSPARRHCSRTKVGRSFLRGAAFEAPVAKDEDYADGRVANETIVRLKAAKARRAKDGTPFFIAAGFGRPHLPFSRRKILGHARSGQAATGGQQVVSQGRAEGRPQRGGEIAAQAGATGGPIDDDLARKLIHGYYASTTYVDAQIGKVTRALDELGLAENTIVVLWGDHGWHLGDLSIWTKHTNFEQVAIPIVISAPGWPALGRHLVNSLRRWISSRPWSSCRVACAESATVDRRS